LIDSRDALALLPGILFWLIHVFWGRLWAWLARRWHENGPEPMARIAAWPGWDPVGRAARAALGVGCLFGLTMAGVWLAAHVALATYARDLTRHLGALLLGMACLGIVWAWVLAVRARAPEPPEADQWEPRWPDLLIEVLDREALLAILRGAILPHLPGIWGVWIAPLSSGVSLWLNGSRQQDPGRRLWVLLAWALDWLSIGLYAAGATLWVLLVARGGCYLLALFIWRFFRARQRHTREQRN